MRIALSVIFCFLIALLVVCAVLAFRSHKPIGKSVGIFVSSLVPPVAGNLLIIASIYEGVSAFGCYIYFLGMNLVMAAVARFTFDYCNIKKYRKVISITVYVILILDSIQLLLNIFTHHAFTIESITAYGSVYYRFIPLWGQTIHRVVDYVILAGVLLTFIVETIVTPKVYSERYLVILLAMIAVSAWQTFYIFSRTPVDISMTGFAVFGLLVFLLSLYYRPFRLLDRMLATIASRMPEALIFFDTNDRCIWINKKASELLGVEDDDLDDVSRILINKLGIYQKEGAEWSTTSISGTGTNIVSYVIEKHAVIDHKNHIVGSYLSIRDNSVEQQTIQRESYNAVHDPLTKAYNRAGYDLVMKDIELTRCFLILVDIDYFKETNDKHGHTIGDQVLVKIVNCIKENFREQDCVCRIGGDEFAVIIKDADSKTPTFVEERINAINKLLKTSKDELPNSSISAGGAFGKDAENSYELFNNADHALYETKFKGKCGFTSFKNR